MNNVIDVVIKTVHFIQARGLHHQQFNCLLEESVWLSLGAVLTCSFELRGEIQRFMDQKGKDVTELCDNDWLQGLAFMVDITEHLNWLNVRMQGRNQVVTEYYNNIRVNLSCGRSNFPRVIWCIFPP